MPDLTRRSGKHPPIWVVRGGLLAVLVAVILAGVAGSASAVIVHPRSGPPVSYLPLEGTHAASSLFETAAAEYHGGPVMPSNTNYTIYWDPAGGPAYPAGYESGVNRYFEDLAHDSGGKQNVDSVAAQYGDGEGHFATYESHFGGMLVDEDPYPANGCSKAPICFTKAQLEEEVRNYVVGHSLPHDLTHEYYLLTPPGVEDCLEGVGCSAGSSEPHFCAYHSFLAIAGGTLVWSNDPYVSGNIRCDDPFDHPNNPASDGIMTPLSHEHIESITDPEGDAWYGPGHYEIGDKCETRGSFEMFGPPLGKAPDGSSYNQVINGDLYWYQMEFSNLRLTCEQRQAPSVATLKPVEGAVDAGYSQKLVGMGGTPPYAWSVESGSLPAGLRLNSQTGALLGTPTAAGTSNFTVRITDSSSPTPETAAAALKIAVGAASAEAAEWGVCAAQKKAEYTDASCQAKAAKAHKGSHEWIPGPAANCIAQKKGEYVDSACTTKSAKPHKGHYEKGPGPGFGSSSGAVTLETPELGPTVTCSASSASGQVTGTKAGSERITLTGCEAAGKRCSSEGPNSTPSGVSGEIVTNLLATRLMEPSPGSVWSQLISAEHEPYLAELGCEGVELRVIGSLAGVQTGDVNAASASSTTTFASGQGEQALATELSEDGGASWKGPYPALETRTANVTAAAASEIKG